MLIWSYHILLIKTFSLILVFSVPVSPGHMDDKDVKVRIIWMCILSSLLRNESIRMHRMAAAIVHVVRKCGGKQHKRDSDSTTGLQPSDSWCHVCLLRWGCNYRWLQAVLWSTELFGCFHLTCMRLSDASFLSLPMKNTSREGLF